MVETEPSSKEQLERNRAVPRRIYNLPYTLSCESGIVPVLTILFQNRRNAMARVGPSRRQVSNKGVDVREWSAREVTPCTVDSRNFVARAGSGDASRP